MEISDGIIALIAAIFTTFTIIAIVGYFAERLLDSLRGR